MDQQFMNRLQAGDRRALAQAITLVESTLEKDRVKAETLLSSLSTFQNGQADCLGITGAPGAGKSTFIEALGSFLVNQGKKVAVLAVDPSSPLVGGSILADKTRMGKLSRHPNAYVRPSASGAGYLGGLTPATGDAIAVLEGAGFDVILVETIGVGQNETAIHDFVDLVIYLLAPAAGDELQAIKKGITEIADILVVNKDDGSLQAAAEHTALAYAGEIPLFKCSSLDGKGILEIWTSIELIERKKSLTRQEKQRLRRFQERLQLQVMATFMKDPAIKDLYPLIQHQVRLGKITPSQAVATLIDTFQGD